MQYRPQYISIALASALSFFAAQADPIVIGAGSFSYNQDFDSLDAVTPGDTSFTQFVGWTQGDTLPGWYRQLSNNNTDKDFIGEPVGGTNAPRFINAGDGGTYNPDVEGERALGAMSGNGVAVAFGPVFEVAEGLTVYGVNVDYASEQWFKTTTNAPTDNLEFQYKILDSIATFNIYQDTGWTAVSALDWNQALDLPREASNQRVDGNNAFNNNPVSGAVTFSTPALEGQYIAFRWVSTVPGDSNVSAAMCVDDLTMAFNASDESSGGSGGKTIKIYNADFSYSQNYDSLESGTAAAGGDPISWTWNNGSTLTGWYRAHTVNDNKDFVGEPKGGTVRFINGGNGGSFTGDVTERALGALSTNNNDVALGAVFEVVGDMTLTSVNIDYTAEQWFRTPTNVSSPNNLQFQYKILDSINPDIFNILEETGWTSVTELDWNVADGLPVEGVGSKINGNKDINRGFVPGPLAYDQHTITFPTPVNTGQLIAFRWLLEGPDDNATTPAMLIDNLNIAFNGTDISTLGGGVSVGVSGSTVSLTLGVESSADLTSGFSDVSTISVVTDDPVNNPSNGKVIIEFDSGGADNLFMRLKGAD